MKTRFDHSLANFVTGGLGEVTLIIANLLTRKVLINTLGSEYLGLGSLFTSILSVLSLTELGVGTSIVFHMYKPLAQKETERVLQLFDFFRKAYHAIGAIIAIISCILLPFLPSLIDDPAMTGINIYLLFVLYLLQTLASYFFFGYKSALLQANQKQYIINNIGFVMTLIAMAGQIFVLLWFRNFYFYVMVRTVTTIVQNILVAIWCSRLFPYLRLRPKNRLPKEKALTILKDCYALLIYRVNGVVLYSTDNLIITHYLGLAVMGTYSNFVWISTTIKNVTKILFKSLANSIGNLHASIEKAEKEISVFRSLNLITVVINAVAFTGVINVVDLFIRTVFGENMSVSLFVIILLAVDIYLSGVVQLINTYRNTYGLFQQAKYRPILSSILNLIISLVLVKSMGLSGILIGTIVSMLLTTCLIDSYVIFRFAFKTTATGFFVRNLSYFAVTGISCLCTYAFCFYVIPVDINAGLKIIFYSLTSVIIPMIVFCLTCFRSNEFSLLVQYIKAFLHRYEYIKSKVANLH